jgi:hypothetical protein
VPVGVTYITKAVKNGVWRFLKPEELQGAGLESLREDALEPITKWLAQKHEDLVEETLRDLAGLNDEEERKQYEETLGDLSRALEWARDEASKEGVKTLAELGVSEEDRGIRASLVAFVGRRLAAVFKSGEGRSCWERATFIAGHALAGYPKLPRREWLPEDTAEALGNALRPCAVDAYLTIDSEIPWLSTSVVSFPYYVEAQYARDLLQIRRIRERLGVLFPLADAEAIKAARKTVERLVAKWRGGDFQLREVLHALGLAALATGGETDEETADLLLYAASFAVQQVVVPVAVLLVLAALRPLGDKAPHRYIVVLAAASVLETLDPETVQYIYDTLQQLKNRLFETERRWPLVKAINAYSNLLRKHSEHIKDRWEEAVADMCRLYGEVGKRGAAAAPDRGPSAQRLLDAMARAFVLVAALNSDDLAQLVQKYCSLGDLLGKAEAVRSALEEAAAQPDQLRKIMKNEDFAEWVTVHDPTGDAGELFEELRAGFTYELAHYKLEHAINERGELDEKKLEEAAKEFEKVAEIRRKLKDWRNYLTDRSWALRARVIAAGSWEELFERAKGFWELWKEAEEHLKPTANYLTTAAAVLGECLVYLAASGDKKRAEELLKKRRRLLDYDPRVSVATRLMLRLFGVEEGAKQEEVVEVFVLQLSLAHRLLMQNQEFAERLKSEIVKVVPEARLLLDKVDGRTLVEVLAPEYSRARLALTLLAAVEDRADAVKLHGLLSSVAHKGIVLQPLFRAAYENCGDLNSEGCRMALLKLYYYHF